MNFYCRRLLLIQALLVALFWEGMAQKQLPITHYKYKVILSVCQKIAAARVDVRKLPALEVRARNNSSKGIAELKWQPVAKIVVDERLYDLCKTFAADSLHALACVIGHELSHFYENHNNPVNFSDSKALASIDSVQVESDKVRLEGQADYFGLFYGFLAGFDTYRLLPHILDAIYKEYNLPQQIPGYPSKKERMNIATKIIQEVIPLIGIFEAAQILYLRKNYREAAICYNYLLDKFPAREIYNNIGVTKLALATELIDVEEVYFAYPFELEAETRLKRIPIRTTDNKVARQQTIDSLLTGAQQDFEKMILSDASYISGYINLACVYSLQNNQESAVGKIKELERFCSSNRLSIPANAYLIKGIARVKMGQVEMAESDFNQASNKNAYLASYNLALYKKIKLSWQNKMKDWLSHWPVVEDWIFNFLEEYKSTTRVKLEKSLVESVKFNSPTLSGNPLILSQGNIPVKIISADDTGNRYLDIEMDDHSLIVFTTSSYYNGRTVTGISIGSLLHEVLTHYGKPTSIASGGNGMLYYNYEASRIIFEIQQNKVKGWSTYRIKF